MPLSDAPVNNGFQKQNIYVYNSKLFDISPQSLYKIERNDVTAL